MILLNSTMKLQAYTTDTPSTPLKFYVYYSDFKDTFSYDALVPSIGTFDETQTDIVGAVGAGKFRNIKTLMIHNSSDALQTVNIVIDVAGVDFPLFKLEVNAGSHLTYNDSQWTTTTTAIIGTDLITLNARGAAPTAPGDGTLNLYDLPIAGRQLPRFIGPSGLDSALQPALFGNGICLISPNTTTSMSAVGTVAPTFVGTVSTPTLSSISLRTSSRRSQISSSAALNSVSEMRVAFASMWRGNSPEFGGFFIRQRIAIGSSVATQRLAVGVWNSTSATVTTVEPSAIVNSFLFGNDLGDTNYQIMWNTATGAASKIDLGSDFPKGVADEIFDVTFFSPPNGSYVGYEVYRLNDGKKASGILDTNLLVSTVFLAPHAYLNNGGTAASVMLDIMKVYIETDQ